MHRSVVLVNARSVSGVDAMRVVSGIKDAIRLLLFTSVLQIYAFLLLEQKFFGFSYSTFTNLPFFFSVNTTCRF